MGNRNKSKRKSNFDLNQSQSTERCPDGASIYRQITADVLERQFHRKRKVGRERKITFFINLFFTTNTPTDLLQLTGTTNTTFRCIRNLEEKYLFSTLSYLQAHVPDNDDNDFKQKIQTEEADT